MLQLKNHSKFAPGIALFPDPDGIDTLYVAVKATFAIGPGPDAALTLADEQLPLRPKDEHWGEPGVSSVKYAGEVHPSKPGTDVALVGSAHAPGGRPVAQLDVALTVAGRRKLVRVFGDRVWVPGLLGGVGPSDPEPFTKLPLVWERAFGGTRLEDPERPLGIASNPVGRGFRGKRGAREFAGEPVPNLEDPEQPLKAPSDGRGVAPQGFGFVAAHWQPRVAFAGTYDAAWQASRAPYLPVDFDSRFLCAAAPGLVFTPHLTGGEPVELVHASPDGALRFALPRVTPTCTVDIAGTIERPPFQLETVLIEPDDRRLCLLWRAALSCDKRALKVRTVEVFADVAAPEAKR